LRPGFFLVKGCTLSADENGVRGIQESPRLISLRRAIHFVALSLIAVCATSCVTTGFKQSAAVALELRFDTWAAVCITKPDTRENGFIPVLTGAETLQEIKRLNVPHGLAAVVVGYNYDEQQAFNIAAEWHKQLAELGFQRVVVLRGTDKRPIAGLPIVYDSAISSVNDTRGLLNPHAAASPTARADVAHPSIAAVR
jgi:hypothetical protein